MAIVTLEEAKQYLRVDFDEDDGLITTLIDTAERLCRDVARVRSVTSLAAYPAAKPAVLYTVAYLYEHREDADHHALTLTLRSLLFGIRGEILMNIAAMRVKVTFQKNEPREDEIGNRWNEWSDYISCRATVGTSSGSERFGTATVNPEGSLGFTCRYCRELSLVESTKYRILAEGKVYNITYVNSMGFKRNSIKFNCRLEKPQ